MLLVMIFLSVDFFINSKETHLFKIVLLIKEKKKKNIVQFLSLPRLQKFI